MRFLQVFTLYNPIFLHGHTKYVISMISRHLPLNTVIGNFASGSDYHLSYKYNGRSLFSQAMMNFRTNLKLSEKY